MKRSRHNPPPRSQVILAHLLAIVWCMLIAFAVVSIYNPPWLQALSQPGIYSEARGFKDRGDVFLHGGDYGAAIAHYQRSLAIQPNQVGVTVNLAVAYGRHGQRSRAIELLEAALESAPQRAGVIHYNLGEQLEQQGRLEQAIEHYEQAIGDDVPQELVYRQLAGLHLKMHAPEAARACFEKSLACLLDVRLPYMYMLNRASQEEKATSEERAVVAAQLERGVTEADLARFDLALIREIQARSPEIAKTHNHLGVLCAQLGDAAAAVKHFEKSLEIWPGNPDAARALNALRHRPVNEPE